MAKKILTPEERWERGIDHDDRSVKLIDALAEIDEKYNKGNVDIRTGGDGDNGEEWAYLLDIYFELEDAKKPKDGAKTPTSRPRRAVRRPRLG